MARLRAGAKRCRSPVLSILPQPLPASPNPASRGVRTRSRPRRTHVESVVWVWALLGRMAGRPPLPPPSGGSFGGFLNFLPTRLGRVGFWGILKFPNEGSRF